MVGVIEFQFCACIFRVHNLCTNLTEVLGELRGEEGHGTAGPYFGQVSALGSNGILPPIGILRK